MCLRALDTNLKCEIYHISHYAQKTCAEMRINMESLVGRSQNVAAIIERKKKNKKAFFISAGIIILAAVLLGAIYNYYINIKYNGYKIEERSGIKNKNSASYASYNDYILKYSKDGIVAQDASGKELWNGSYDMASSAIDICGEYVVVADVGEKNFIVYNGDDSGKEITTDYPIVQAEVSKQGVVAVLLEESSSNVIRIYNPYDVQNKLLAEIPTNIDDGYPVSIDISDDGVNVAAVFVSVNDSKIQSRVAFYDFSDVGKNSNFLVGAQVYNDKLISEVKYLNDNDICVFGEDGYCVWTNLRQPKVKFQKKYGTSIKSAFYNSKYIGVILDADDGNKNELEVFELSGKRKLKIELSEQYKQVQLNDNNEIMLNSDSKCVIYKMNGIKKFSSNIKGKVEHFYASGDNKCYYLVLENEIQKIKLKKIKKRG